MNPDLELLPAREPIRRPVQHLRRSKAARADSARGFIVDDDLFTGMKVFVRDSQGDHVYTPLSVPDVSDQLQPTAGLVARGLWPTRHWNRRRRPHQAQGPDLFSQAPMGGVSKYRRLRNRQAYWSAQIHNTKVLQEMLHPRLRRSWNAPDRVELMPYPGSCARAKLARWCGPIPEFIIKLWTPA